MKKRGKEKKNRLNSGALKASLVGTLGAISIFILMLSIFSAIGLSFEKPHAYVPPLSYLATYGASFFGGFIASKKNGGHNVLLCGVICGVILCLTLSLIFLIIGLVLDADSTASSWIFRALTVVFPIFGALLGMKRKSKPKKRKRRR